MYLGLGSFFLVEKLLHISLTFIRILPTQLKKAVLVSYYWKRVQVPAGFSTLHKDKSNKYKSQNLVECAGSKKKKNKTVSRVKRLRLTLNVRYASFSEFPNRGEKFRTTLENHV